MFFLNSLIMPKKSGRSRPKKKSERFLPTESQMLVGKRALEDIEQILIKRHFRTWSSEVKEPEWGHSQSPVALRDGRYYSRWPSGAIRLLAHVKDGYLESWIRLNESSSAGDSCRGWFAQRYYSNGRLENFSPYDDDSPPFPANSTFGEWVKEQVELYFLPSSTSRP
jgi:hypothetical protein